MLAPNGKIYFVTWDADNIGELDQATTSPKRGYTQQTGPTN